MKKSLEDLDEIDKAVLRTLITDKLIELERVLGFTVESNEELSRLRALYSFFMRGNTRQFRILKERIK